MAALDFLKDHPFAVEAFFERSVVFTFAAPKENLEHLLPDCLTLDTFKDEFGFLAVAMVETKDLRPKGMPRFTGNDFMLIGYRIFVRYTRNNGKRLRGLYILKSETNRKKMEFFGNIFTHYNYSTTDINFDDDSNGTSVISEGSNFKAAFQPASEDQPLPKGSPFDTWKEARRFAGPLPFTFTYNSEEKEVLIIEGVRQNWKPQPLNVTIHQFEFIDTLNIDGITLANAFQITKVPYYWKKGVKEIWKG